MIEDEGRICDIRSCQEAYGSQDLKVLSVRENGSLPPCIEPRCFIFWLPTALHRGIYRLFKGIIVSAPSLTKEDSVAHFGFSSVKAFLVVEESESVENCKNALKV